jgi:hypothetical protein
LYCVSLFETSLDLVCCTIFNMRSIPTTNDVATNKEYTTRVNFVVCWLHDQLSFNLFTSTLITDKRIPLVFTVVPCMLFQSLFYCSNSCISLHFKTPKSHTKTLRIPWNSIDQIGTPPTHTHTHTHTHRRNKLTYIHIPTPLITNVNQYSNSVT